MLCGRAAQRGSRRSSRGRRPRHGSRCHQSHLQSRAGGSNRGFTHRVTDLGGDVVTPMSAGVVPGARESSNPAAAIRLFACSAAPVSYFYNPHPWTPTGALSVCSSVDCDPHPAHTPSKLDPLLHTHPPLTREIPPGPLSMCSCVYCAPPLSFPPSPINTPSVSLTCEYLQVQSRCCRLQGSHVVVKGGRHQLRRRELLRQHPVHLVHLGGVGRRAWGCVVGGVCVYGWVT